MAKRVHQLAKELGVKSTAIVTKCNAEGLDVKNHMATLSAGLEATIREWFSGQELSTTVEESAPVDLEKVKTKKKSKMAEPAKTVQDDSDDKDDKATEAEIQEPAPQQTPVKTTEPAVADMPLRQGKELPKRVSPQEQVATEIAPEPQGPESVEPSIDDSPVSEVPEEVKTQPQIIPEPTDQANNIKKSKSKAKAKKTEHQGPRFVGHIETNKPLAPAPKPINFIPKPAVLSGPKVIRTEKAEYLPAPPGRGPRRPRFDSGPTNDVDNQPIPAATGSSAKKTTKKRHAKHVSEEEKNTAARKKVTRSGRRGGNKDIMSFRDRDLAERQARLAAASSGKLHKRERRMTNHGGGTQAQQKKIEQATIKEPVIIKDLCAAIGIRANQIIGKLMGMGIMANVNASIDTDSAMMVALEFGVELTVEEQKSMWDSLAEDFETIADQDIQPRPPVVAFLGHVDHGKTSLLDYIRKESVTKGEAGGITQHIGSYLYDDGKRRVTFLDTPGHKAFTEMRARGANMTDIVVLVVAADDGIMPQTEEAINHAKAAGVPIVVAMNKIDMPSADPTRVMGQLAEHELVPTEWGGDVEVIQTSAINGTGMTDLVEILDYVAEVHALKARTEGDSTGWVIESNMTSHFGPVARMLVKEGTLNVGDIVVTGSSHGRIRTMTDATGEKLQSAGPSSPVVITGLSEVPIAGDRFYVINDASKSAQIAAEQQEKKRQKNLARRSQITLENLFAEIKAGEVKELNVIVKADVQGSVDVLCNALTELNTAEVAVRVLHAAVGPISESDVVLAQASNAIIIGFQVVADEHSRSLAERENVEIRLYRIIYQISDDIRKALEGMLEPTIQEKPLGRAEVRQIFKISRLGTIAGCIVKDGSITRNAKIRVVRDGIIIRDETPMDSLKRIKDDASEVKSGYECGIKLIGFDDLKPGDILEAFEYIEVARTLD
ncbi:MAG: translation initiation factor IF-2 [Phycisphaerae bacterium]|nr:translation initiation factor IF-2 [Phycisphaerae bacterium]